MSYLAESRRKMCAELQYFTRKQMKELEQWEAAAPDSQRRKSFIEQPPKFSNRYAMRSDDGW
jgi:hypothetical protein